MQQFTVKIVLLLVLAVAAGFLIIGDSAENANAAGSRQLVVVGGITGLKQLDNPCDKSSDNIASPSAHTSQFNSLASYLRNVYSAQLRSFSYNSNWPTSTSYGDCETRQHLSTSAATFDRQFEYWKQQAQGAPIDIVAHSLGGVVVAYWLGRVASTSDLAEVHSVVALGSPLGGISNLASWASLLFGVGGNVSSDLQNSTVLGYVAAGVKKVPFYTVNNTRDAIVNGTVGRGFSTANGVWFSDTASFGGSCTILGCNAHDAYFLQSSGAWLLPLQAYISDLIIDDVSSRFARGGPSARCPAAGSNTKSWYWCWANIGYRGHMWYTWNASSGADVNYGVWRPRLPQARSYRVCAYIPPDHAYTTAARYKIYYAGGSKTVSVNQQPLIGWKDLGVYQFSAGTNGYVRLGDVTGERYASTQIGFDAVKWVPSSRNCLGG